MMDLTRQARTVGSVLRATVDAWPLDQWDAICLTGVVLLTVGMWQWFGAGPALTVVGGLLLALGVAGARRQTETARPDG